MKSYLIFAFIYIQIMTLILRAFEGFNTLPRDIRIYVLAPMLNDVDLAACYLAVSCKEPSDLFVQRMVARGCYDPNWCTTHKYAVICGAAEAGNEELFWGLARKRNYENVITTVNCHHMIWNMLSNEVPITKAKLLLRRVVLGYPLTGCIDIDSDDAQWLCNQTTTVTLIERSHASMRKNTIDWLVHHEFSPYWIMTGIINLDDAELAEHMLPYGAEVVRSMCMDGYFSHHTETPRLYQWSAMLLMDEIKKSFDGMN